MSDSRTGDGSDRLRELHHAATDILAAPDAATVYRTTVETAETVLGFDFCSVMVPADDGFEVVASSHRDRGATVPARDGVLEHTFREGEGVLVEDIASSALAQPLESEFRSGISVPVGDDAVLQAVSTTRGYYSGADLELAELLALHAEAALDQVRSRALVREQKRKIEELHAVSTALESCHTREELYELMLDASQEILGFDWCTLYLLEDGEFVTAITSEQSPVKVGERPFPEGTSKAREVLETGNAHLVDDVHEADVGEPTTDRIRSALQVPVGDIGVYSAAHERPGMFDRNDLELAELLASSVAEAHQRIAAHEQLRARKRELQRKNEHLDEFASIISHDLRNPLNVARLRTEFIAEEAPDEHTEALETALDRMETMIDQLLTMARAGQEIDAVEPCSLQETVREAWVTVPTEGVELDSRVGDATVEADRDRLLHVLENLFRNTVDHNDPPLVVRTGPLGSRDGFYVEDDGQGIPDDERDRVFDHGYTTSDEGAGLGLAVVRDIVEAHGWEVTVTESEEGGARFEIVTDGA